MHSTCSIKFILFITGLDRITTPSLPLSLPALILAALFLVTNSMPTPSKLASCPLLTSQTPSSPCMQKCMTSFLRNGFLRKSKTQMCVHTRRCCLRVGGWGTSIMRGRCLIRCRIEMWPYGMQ
uniref:Uncharacterized protein n=1 Tax=Rhizophora mucronata TaxID=61149 RepID=A0A2P2Q6H2_RHIMU